MSNEEVHQYSGPYTVLPMPLTEDGRGPASLNNAHRVVWQIWDSLNQTVAECYSQKVAKQLSAFLNSQW